MGTTSPTHSSPSTWSTLEDLRAWRDSAVAACEGTEIDLRMFRRDLMYRFTMTTIRSFLEGLDVGQLVELGDNTDLDMLAAIAALEEGQ